MAQEISITRFHALGLELAMDKARALVTDLSQQYGLKHQWSGNNASLKHGLTGITGQLKVAEDELRVYVDLNFLQRALKGLIEAEINKVLDSALT